jgi:ribosomal protein S18 acetylase RimI-like enzyme
MVTVAPYCDEHFDGVAALWEEVFPQDPPWNRAPFAIPQKLAVQPELLLVAHDEGAVIGTAMAGYDGHRGWLYAVAVRPDRQREGIGTLLLGEAEQRLHAMGCAKINLQIRAGNEAVAAFYRRQGYEVEERVSMGKRVVL